MNSSRYLIFAIGLCLLTTSCGRHIRTARDITPGNPAERELDWKYGANDIRIQTTKVIKTLMDRWELATVGESREGRPQIVITKIDNRTDQYISSDIIRDCFESAAVGDGRFSILVGDSSDESELDALMEKIQNDSKYAHSTCPEIGIAKAPQFLAKVRLTKAGTHQKFYDIEDYRMTVTLYDVELQQAVDSAYDVLRKQVRL